MAEIKQLTSLDLKKKLVSRKPGERSEALTAIATVKNRRAIMILIDHLKDPHWTVRRTAYDCLLEFGELALQPIISALDSDNYDTHYWSIELLAKIGKGGIPPLLELLNSPNRTDRLHTVKVMTYVKDPRAIEYLLPLLGDIDWTIRKNAAETLIQYGSKCVPLVQKSFSQNLNQMGNDEICYWSMIIMASVLKDEAVNTFISLLDHQDKNIRFYGTVGLGHSESMRAVSPLIKSLSDSSLLVRESSFEMLAKLGPLALNMLKQNAFNSSDDVMRYCLRLIGRIMKEDAVEILKKNLSTPHKEVRIFIVQALGETMDPRAVEVLCECFTDNYWPVRKAAAEAIIPMKHRAIEPLMNIVGADNEDVRYWGTYTMGRIGVEALPALLELIEHSNDRMRFYVVKALENVMVAEAIEPLIQRLGDEYWPVRDQAAINLLKIGTPAIKPLIIAVGSSNDNISFWVKDILSRFGDKAVSTLMLSLNDPSKEIRKYAIIALAKIGTKSSVKPLLEIFASGVLEESELVIESLKNIRNEELLVHLLEAVASADEHTIDWIFQVLCNIGEDGKMVLFKNLKHSNENIRYWILRTLSTREGPDILRAFVFSLSDPSPKVRAEAVDGIADIGEGLEIVPHIVKMLDDPELEVRAITYKVLGRMGDISSIKPIVDHFIEEEEINQNFILELFREIESGNFILSLVNLLDESDDKQAESISRIISLVCESPAKRDILVKALESGETSGNKWLIRVLSSFNEEKIVKALLTKIDDDSVKNEIVDGLSDLIVSSNWVLRDLVISKFTETGVIIIEPLLISCLSRDDFFKKTIFDIIENMGEEIIEPLEELSNKQSSIRSMAITLSQSLKRSSMLGIRKPSAPKEVPKIKKEEKRRDDELEDIMAKMQLK